MVLDKASVGLTCSALLAGADVATGTIAGSDLACCLIGEQLGDLDLSVHLSQYRDHEVTVVIAVTGKADSSIICGFVMNEVQECPRCKEINAEIAKGIRAWQEERAALLREVEEILRGEDE